jgi:hypothetical protein
MVKGWPDKVATLQVNSTYSATKSQRKILLNRLVVDYSPRFSDASLHFALVMIFQMMTYFGTL